MTPDIWTRLDIEDEFFECVDYEVTHADHDGGESQTVELTVGREGLTVTHEFPIEAAEEFIVRFRNAVVRAKQAELEWQTNTDPSSGVPDEEEDDS